MLRFSILALVAFMLAGCADRHPFEPQLSVARWKDNYKGAVALTFDDWTPGHPSIVVPELQKRGMVATFNVITGNVSDWEPLRKAVALGNEVANHTVTHPHPNGISFEQEILLAKQKIEAEIPQQRVHTFAYPYGEFTDSLRLYLEESGYVAARGVKTPMPGEDFAFSDSVDYFDTKAYSVMTETSLADFATQLGNVEQSGGMLTYLYHSIYSDSIKDFSYAWVIDSTFRQQLETLMLYDLWVATYADMIRYHRQYCATKIEKVKSSPTAYVFRLKAEKSLDEQTPLTLLFKSSIDGIYVEDACKIKVMQDGKQLSVKPVSFNILENGKVRKAFSYDEYVFDAMPNGGDISIELNK